MHRIGKIVRVFLAVAILISNSRITPVTAASLAVFSDYGSGLMVMDPAYWDLSSMTLSGGTITPLVDASGSASFVVDISTIAAAIDDGGVKINFSATAYIADEGAELDLASIAIGFGSTSGFTRYEYQSGSNHGYSWFADLFILKCCDSDRNAVSVCSTLGSDSGKPEHSCVF